MSDLLCPRCGSEGPLSSDTSCASCDDGLTQLPVPGLDDLTPEVAAREIRGAVYQAQQTLHRAKVAQIEDLAQDLHGRVHEHYNHNLRPCPRAESFRLEAAQQLLAGTVAPSREVKRARKALADRYRYARSQRIAPYWKGGA